MNRGSDHLARIRARVLHDAFLEASRAYWLRRAATFEAAAPRPGDFTGRATEADLDAATRRCVDVAVACRNRAALDDVTTLDFLDTLDAIAGAAA